MLKLRGRLDLAQESLTAEGGRELRVQDLDRDVAIVLEVVREINGCHAAGTKFALDAVAIGDGGRQTRQDVVHVPVLDSTAARFSSAEGFSMTNSRVGDAASQKPASQIK